MSSVFNFSLNGFVIRFLYMLMLPRILFSKFLDVAVGQIQQLLDVNLTQLF